jgi:peroxiredoxin
MPLVLLLLVAQLGACERPAAEPEGHVPVGAEAGLRAPVLVGMLADGQPFRLEPGSTPTLLIFYRAAQCGLCRLQLEQTQQHLVAYRRHGLDVIAATLDPPELSARLLQSNPLDFQLVSVDDSVFEEWGVLNSETGVAMPAIFLLDRRGIVRYVHIGRNAADRPTDAGLLTVLERLEL